MLNLEDKRKKKQKNFCVALILLLNNVANVHADTRKALAMHPDNWSAPTLVDAAIGLDWTDR